MRAPWRIPRGVELEIDPQPWPVNANSRKPLILRNEAIWTGTPAGVTQIRSMSLTFRLPRRQDERHPQ